MNRSRPFAFLLAFALPFAALSVSATASAQTPPPAAAQKAPTTSIDGQIARMVITPHGRVSGLLLRDGTLVHVGDQGALASLRPGATVHVEGVLHRTPTGNLITRSVVQHEGKVISNNREIRKHAEKARGDRHARQKLTSVSATARISQVLMTPKGKVHAILLDDGTSATGHGLEAYGLKSGDRVTVTGKGATYAQGKALHIQTITLPNGETKTLPAPQRRHHPRAGAGQQQPV